MNKKTNYLLILILQSGLIFLLTLAYLYYSFKSNYLNKTVIQSIESNINFTEQDLQLGNYRGFVQKMSSATIAGQKIISVRVVSRKSDKVLAANGATSNVNCKSNSKKYVFIPVEDKYTEICWKYNDFLSLGFVIKKFTFSNFLINFNYLIFIIALGLIALLTAYLQFKAFNNFIEGLLKFLLKVLSSEKGNKVEYPDEYKTLVSPINEIKDNLQKLREENTQLFANEQLSKVAHQVAHDIRSPLSAFEVIAKDLDVLPEKKRTLIREAINRINDIAYDLIEKNRLVKDGKVNSLESPEYTETSLISIIVSSLISEKRLALRNLPNIEVENLFNSTSYGLFAKINPNDLKRILSNLINNSIESFTEERGAVIVSIEKASSDLIKIIVKDNGPGIPADVLSQLGKQRITSHKKNGSGVGVLHAKTKIESWGGIFEIHSSHKSGTEAHIFLPKTSPPKYFVPEIKVFPQQKIVVVDDDRAIHGLWDEMFAPFIKENISIIHFQSPDQFLTWNASNKADLYLVDFEFIGEKTWNGLKLASKIPAGANINLVTSHYSKPEIIAKCIDLKIGLIPKALAGKIPMSLVEPTITRAASGQSDTKTVLLDDDPLVIEIWQMAAKDKKINLEVFTRPKELFEALNHTPKDTHFYIDSNLGDEEKGEEIAKKIFDRGFKKISLATGSPKEDFAHLDYLIEVIGKEPPF